ncbi:phosphoribosylformylglycinamidine cyclo-ligase, partial [bacterium]|nr:phosphoribosylformylglycinamidine cyclo-ligase [bacterium]
MSLTYKQSGVDIEAGDRLVDWLKSNPSGEKSKYGNLVSGIGGFSAIFKTDFSKFKNPCLVSATDGVGTKILLAAQYERFIEVAQ